MSVIEGSLQPVVCAELVSLGPLLVPVVIGVRPQSGSAMGIYSVKINYILEPDIKWNVTIYLNVRI